MDRFTALVTTPDLDQENIHNIISPWTWIFKIGRKSKVVCGPEKPRPTPTCFDSCDTADCRTPAEIVGHGANVETTSGNKYVGKEWKLSCERCILSWGDPVWVCAAAEAGSCFWTDWRLTLLCVKTTACFCFSSKIFLRLVDSLLLPAAWLLRLQLQLQLTAPK